MFTENILSMKPTRAKSSTNSASQSADRDRQSSSAAPSKKRKVLSLSEYVSNKKPTSSTTKTTTNSTEKQLTETQIKEIYEQFNANSGELAEVAPNLANNVNKKLTQKESFSDGRVNSITKPSKSKVKSIWDEDEDDDDEDDHPQTPPSPKQPEPKRKKIEKTSSNAHAPQIPALAPPPMVKKVPVATTSSIAPAYYPPSQPVAQLKTNNIASALRSKKERHAIYSGKRAIRTSVSSLQDLCLETLKENLEDVSHKHFYLLPYDLVKSVIEAASPEQLYRIVDNNPDYADEVEHMWKHFCSLRYKDEEREECETYYELYWRKHNEQEDRLRQITELAKRKKEQTVDLARQTKKLAFPQTRAGRSANSSGLIPSSHRTLLTLPSSKMSMGGAKGKKSSITPLMKKTLKLYSGKG